MAHSSNPGSVPEMLAAVAAMLARQTVKTDAEIDALYGKDDGPEEEN
jgi:hypothetical protein